jgi:hypothetical protein
MTLYLSILALTLMLAFIADTTITICPFSISVARPWVAMVIVVVMGLFVVREVRKK